MGKFFQRRGATAEKAQFLIPSFQTSLGVRPLSCPAWLERVTLAELGGRRCSARYLGPKLFIALYVIIRTLKSMWK